jgi:CelD/BcsL family acetyltransferase involved in cellulose biosynthesis
LASKALDRREEAAQRPHPALPQTGIRLAARSSAHFTDPQALMQWNALADRASTPNPFYESWYLLPSLRALDPHGDVTLLCLEADGVLSGLLPVRRETAYYSYPFPNLRGWAHANCFVGAPLVAKGCEAAFWRALFRWADENAGASLFFHLANMPLNGSLYDGLREVLAEQGREAALVHSEERAMLESELASQAYFEAALKAKRRSELERKRRRLSELGEFTITRQNDAAGIEEWSRRFLALEQASWKGRAGSALACDQANETLFCEALSGAAALGRLERLELSLDGRPIAMMTTFLTPPGAFGFKTAFDQEFARFSPGVLLQRENLALLERPGIDWCDSCAAEDHPMIDHFWRERRTIGRISIAIGGRLRRAGFAAIARAEKGTML